MTSLNPEARRPRSGRPRRRSAAAPLLTCLALLSAPLLAEAQEVERRGSAGGCIALLIRDVIPAVAEPSFWISGGGGVRFRDGARDGLGILGAGAEVTAGLATLGSEHRYGGPFELRWGPWTNVVTDLSGARAEGGLLLSVGQVKHAQWGTYALRVGGGIGDDGLGLSPHVVATLTGGVRYVEGRYSFRGACDPTARPEPSAFASGVRVFGSARAALTGEGGFQLTFGLELEPTFFFPPYSLRKWIGAHP